MAQLTGNKIKDTYLGLLKTNGSGILTSGFQRITDGSGLGSQLYLSLTQIKFYDAYIFPDADGSANQVLKTDGAGVLTWENDSLSNTLNFSGGTGTGLVTLDTQVLAFTGTANEIETSASSQAITLSFPTAGVTLPNGSIATTQTASNNSTKVATTAYVDAALTLKLDLAGGTMSGDIAMGANNLSGAGTVSATTFLGDLNGTINTATTATTQSAGDNSTKVATTAYVDNQVSTAGTVTSVALSVPTGLTVTGSPITTSGTIAIANTSGYSIPTDAKQTQWDTAYTNRITTATSPLSITTNTISLNTVPVSNGGTGATTLTGILLGNGTSAISSITSANDGYILTADGVGGYAFEVASGGDVNVSGTPVANQIAIWTDATTIKGDPTFIIDSNHKITLYQPNSVPTSLLNYNIGGGNIANTTGSINTGFGYNNLNSVTSGYANNAFGSEALLSLSTGYNNVAIGLTAGKLITAATDNVFIGGSSARNKITGNFNIAIGASAYSGNSGGLNLNSGNYNVIIGSSAMITAVGSNNNVVIGHESSYNNANSENNTAVGFQSLYTSATNNGNNTAIGFKSLYLSTGERNLAIGSLAGSAITTGNKNVIIGSNTGSTIDGLSNRIIISDGDGNIRQYIDDVGNVGIGTDDPSLYPLAPQLVVDTGTRRWYYY
jgi:trimeric autotransporter adhesin